MVNTQDKVNQIKLLLCCSDFSITDIARQLPSKYEEKYQFMKTINSGLQGTINIVKCKETNNKYAMKSIKYKSIDELTQHLQRFFIVYEHKLSDYKDVFIDTNGKILHIIQPLFKETIKERLYGLRSRQFDKLELNSIILQLIQKINNIHSIGYVHHDLTPSNIMFDNQNKLHIIDYDLMEKINTKISTKGTIGFIAPELFIPYSNEMTMKKINSNIAMDMWSIGSLICYISFKGNVPFNNIIDNKRINNIKQYMNMYKLLDENEYRDNKWSFIIDVKMDYSDDYDVELFQLISELLTFEANYRPNTSMLLMSDEYSWFNQQS
eukprot:109651_1